MKDDTGNFTRRRFATPPADFRALATGCGQSMDMSEDSGNARRAKILANPSKLSKAGIASAPVNEGWGPTDQEDLAETASWSVLDADDELPEAPHPWRRG